MSMRPALALKAAEGAQDLEDQGGAEEDGAGGDAFSKRHPDIRTGAVIRSILPELLRKKAHHPLLPFGYYFTILKFFLRLLIVNN